MFIENIKTLNVDVQTAIVEHIKEVSNVKNNNSGLHNRSCYHSCTLFSYLRTPNVLNLTFTSKHFRMGILEQLDNEWTAVLYMYLSRKTFNRNISFETTEWCTFIPQKYFDDNQLVEFTGLYLTNRYQNHLMTIYRLTWDDNWVIVNIICCSKNSNKKIIIIQLYVHDEE